MAKNQAARRAGLVDLPSRCVELRVRQYNDGVEFFPRHRGERRRKLINLFHAEQTQRIGSSQTTQRER
jgi:hypothetical protein